MRVEVAGLQRGLRGSGSGAWALHQMATSSKMLALVSECLVRGKGAMVKGQRSLQEDWRAVVLGCQGKEAG